MCPANCDPAGPVATSTAITARRLLASPHWGGARAKRSICDLNADPAADPNASGSTVSFFFMTGATPPRSLGKAQGRVEFLHKSFRCPDDQPCLASRTGLNSEDISVPSGLGRRLRHHCSAHGVGESSPARGGARQGRQGGVWNESHHDRWAWTQHRRATTMAFLAPNLEGVSVGLFGGWKLPRAARLMGLDGHGEGLPAGHRGLAATPRRTAPACGGDCNEPDQSSRCSPALPSSSIACRGRRSGSDRAIRAPT